MTSWVDYFQAIGAIATAIAVAFVAYQAKQTRRQTTIMQEQLPRAWVGDGSNPSNGQKVSYENERLVLYCKNYGQLPASVSWVKSATSESEITESNIRAATESHPNTIIFPDHERTFSTDSDLNVRHLPPEEIIIWFGFIVEYVSHSKDIGEYGILGKFHVSLAGSWPEQTDEWFKPRH